MVEIKEVEIKDWKGLQMSQDNLRLGFTPEIGGRLISLIYKGVELLFTQKEHEGEVFYFPAGTDLIQKKKRLGFRLFGGDKTWVAPQNAWKEAIPPLELDAAPYHYTQKGSHIVMQSSTCHETGLKITREIELKANDTITLNQTFHNMTEKALLKGIWDVTQILRPMKVHIPVSNEQVLTYPEEGNSVSLKNQIVTDNSTITCEKADHFKYGATPKTGQFITYREEKDNTLVWLRTFAVGKRYAHNVAVEVYNSPDYPYLEVEVHAPLVSIPPGGEVSHQQTWKFFQHPNKDGKFNPDAYGEAESL